MARLVLAASGVFLAACSSGGSSSDSPDALQNAVSFASIEQYVNDVPYEDDLIADNYTDLAALPTSGSARYEGAVGIGGEANAVVLNTEFIGRLVANVDFGTNEVDGQADNFYINESREALSGTLLLSMDIDRSVDVTTSYSITGTLDGDLTDAAGDTTEFLLDLGGDIYRDDRAFLFGDIDGRVTRPDGRVDDDVDGLFGATLQ